jgi:alkanesulfonate monooxygenase SsuD/methylene tetrahydromethanopterin reductase-like flavin-dependent oxidoreductase (luciferase family)
VAQLAEALQVIRALWTESPATFHGEHYTIERAYGESRPDPVPPILIGTNGPKALRVTARLADGWSWDAPFARFEPAYAALVRACAEVGRDPATLWLTATAEVDFPDDPTTLAAASPAGDEDQGMPPLGPTPADAVRQVRPLVERGVTHIMIDPRSQRTLERFSAEVAPVFAPLGRQRGSAVAPQT